MIVRPGIFSPDRSGHSHRLDERLVIDASHGNCAKDHERQRIVASQIGRQVAAGNTAIRGVMLESFLLDGRHEVVDGHQLDCWPKCH
ncbi:hypothetical protein [Amycolatopsis sp. NPDC049868]|uniref:hypothetical protein n=1 Tax=Amycolatopsis sp. NPDC049868 TaxID=3363934 RepID=UPI0037A4A624